jgi:hypothetical protein
LRYDRLFALCALQLLGKESDGEVLVAAMRKVAGRGHVSEKVAALLKVDPIVKTESCRV